MKKHLLFAFILFVSAMSFAQKSELKAADKAIKNQNFEGARASIQSAESLIGSADSKTKAKFYYLKGQALYANGASTAEQVDSALKSFDKVNEISEQSGKSFYKDEISQLKQVMLNNFLTKANNALNEKDYKTSSIHFENAYNMSKKDELYLYYAAATAVSAKDYDNALRHYEVLRDSGYEGISMQYLATNKETGEEETFDNANVRDLSVKAGTHIAPKDEETESKRPEIIKNIALIYISNGEKEKALKAIKDARENDPDDLNLILSEANIHLKMDNKAEFTKLIEQATLLDPENAELQYNLGFMAAESGDFEGAKNYYNKALELDPKYAAALINMAALILQNEQTVIDQMNELGSSKADDKKYDELLETKNELYREALPFLTQSLELNPDSPEVLQTLMGIYSKLGDDDNFKATKAKLEALEE